MADAAHQRRIPHAATGRLGLVAPIRTVIGEHESTSPSSITNLLSEQLDLDVIDVCANGQEVVKAIEAHRPDLVFLDVQIPGIDAFAIIEAVGSARMPPVVFIATRRDLAVRAFDVHAFDYLVKPLRRRRVEEALDRVREHVLRERVLALAGRLLQQESQQEHREGPAERLMVRCGNRRMFVDTTEIDWIEADGNYVRLHAGTKSYRIRKTISEMEAALGARFARVHRRILVCVARVRELRLKTGGRCDAVLDTGVKLAVGRTHRASLQNRLGRS